MDKQPPTVFKDCRGEIRKLKFHGVEVNLVFTKAGALRSGDVHPSNQHDILLRGKIEITRHVHYVDIWGGAPGPKIGDERDIYRSGCTPHIVICAGTPHLFRSVTSSVVLEWWDGPFKAKYYRPYRKLVEKWIREHSKKGGRDTER